MQLLEGEGLKATIYRKVEDYLNDYSPGEILKEVGREASFQIRSRIEVSKSGNCYEMSRDDIDIVLPKRRHFRDMIKGRVIDAYTAYHDIQEGETVIDGGAFPGEFSIYASKRCGSVGEVISLEPSPGNYSVLEDVIELNDLNNMKTLEKALFSEEGVHNFDTGRGGIEQRLSPEGERRVLTTTIDRIVEERGVEPDLVKMDIEGAEIEALKGAEKTLEDYRPDLAIASYHKLDGRSSGQTWPVVEEMLERHGYRATTGWNPYSTTWGVPEESDDFGRR